MSVGFNVHSVQCQSIASAQFNASSVQSSSVQFLKRSVYTEGRVCSTHSQWCSVVAGLQSTAFMVCLLLIVLFSVGSVQPQ